MYANFFKRIIGHAALLILLLGFDTSFSFAKEQSREPLLGHDELVEDTRQMLELLETVHPQPYFKGGGKVAFHKRFQDILKAIPHEGMTREDFRGLLSPLLASVGDGHTYVYADGSFDFAGVPLLFYVVENELYVSAVFNEKFRQYLGARLRGVEGVDKDELIRRTKNYYGADNIYGSLVQLGNFELFLAKKSVLEDLLPEWVDKSVINISLLMPDGALKNVRLPSGPTSTDNVIRPKAGIELPSLGGREFTWDFLNGSKETAYLRVMTSTQNLETYEKRMTYSNVSEEISDLYENLYDKKPTGTLEETLAALPSLTKTYSEMVRQMKEAGTKALIIDLRTNVGGFALSADILVYFLYGKEALTQLHRRINIATRKLSSHYFRDEPELSLDEMNDLAKKNGFRSYNLSENDYDFSDADKIKDGLLEKEYARKLVEDDISLTSTFWAEYLSETHSNYYRPEEIIVVTDSATFSSGFTFAQYLKLMGATMVGSIPSENIGQMGESFRYELKNSTLGGTISRSYLVHDSKMGADIVTKSHLTLDYELTYEKLKELGFSRPAAIEYALEILAKKDR